MTEIVQAPLLKKFVLGVANGTAERHPVKNAIAKSRMDMVKEYLKIWLCLYILSAGYEFISDDIIK